ncbi:MAG: hypothetical protein WBV94_09720 [Blastocatellia bacterium]
MADADKEKKTELVDSFTVIPEAEQKDNPDAMKVRLRRIMTTKGKDEAEMPLEPVICVPVDYKGEFNYWRPDASKQIFDVDALTAAAAVRTGGFEVDPKSRMKLK